MQDTQRHLEKLQYISIGVGSERASVVSLHDLSHWYLIIGKGQCGVTSLTCLQFKLTKCSTLCEVKRTIWQLSLLSILWSSQHHRCPKTDHEEIWIGQTPLILTPTPHVAIICNTSSDIPLHRISKFLFLMNVNNKIRFLKIFFILKSSLFKCSWSTSKSWPTPEQRVWVLLLYKEDYKTCNRLHLLHGTIKEEIITHTFE